MNDIKLQMKRTKYKLNKLLPIYGINKNRYYSWRNGESFHQAHLFSQNRRNNLLFERMNRSAKSEAIRPNSTSSYQEACEIKEA